MRTPYTAVIRSVSDLFQLDADLLEAQVIVESAGDPNAFRYEPAFFSRYIKGNSKAAGVAFGPLAACSYGLLQILLEVALEQGFTGGPESLFDPVIGLRWGARYFRGLLDWAGGDVERALCAYNGGKGAAVSKPYATAAYAAKVFRAREQM